MEEGVKGREEPLGADLHVLASYQLTEALIESERRMRRRIELLSEIIFETDARGVLVFLNGAWAKTLGYKPEECLGQAAARFVCLEDRAAFQAILDGRSAAVPAASGPNASVQAARHEVRMTRADGGMAWLEISATPLPGGGIVGALHDRTSETAAKRALEEAKERAERMAAMANAANRAKSEFLATVSHEIRTPMNGIIGMTELLQQSRLDASQQEMAKVVSESGHELMRVINDILDFSKMEARRLSLEPAVFDLAALVEGVVGLLAPKARAKGVAMTAAVDPEVPRRLFGDEGRLRQILLNLLGNAIKFTMRGEIALRVSRDVSGNGRILFAVADTGIGIPLEKQGVIFEPFVQADATSTRQYGGTGLGLSICKCLVDLMEGAMGVESRPGAGSRFWFAVPLAPAGIPEPAACEPGVGGPPPAASDLGNAAAWEGHRRSGGLKILVAEDRETNQLVVELVLGKLGHAADFVRDGCEAVEAVRRGRYDVIFMDCQMPQMDGYEATRQIRRLEAADGRGRTHIIAMTANAMSSDRATCLAAGMDAYLSKPITIARVREELEKAVRSRGAGPRR